MGKESLERLPDEQIEAISGGVKDRWKGTCPNCGSFYNMQEFRISWGDDGGRIKKYQCPRCGHKWSRNVNKCN